MEMVKFKQAVIDTYGEEKLKMLSSDPLSENKLSLVVDFAFKENKETKSNGVEVDVTVCGQITLEQEVIIICELLKTLQVGPMELAIAVNTYLERVGGQDNG